jgi:hypothetical protein
MSDVLSDADHELGVQLQILQERDETLHHEMTELLTSPRMMTILGRQRTQKALRWFQNRMSCTYTKSARAKIRNVIGTHEYAGEFKEW